MQWGALGGNAREDDGAREDNAVPIEESAKQALATIDQTIEAVVVQSRCPAAETCEPPLSYSRQLHPRQRCALPLSQRHALVVHDGR